MVGLIMIYTLGDFDIKNCDESIFTNENHHYRLDKLFRYFLTFRDKKISPEKIVEDLWYNEEYVEPRKVVITQISRLRKGIYGEVFYEIIFSNGYYTFYLDKEKTILDVDMFEDFIMEGEKLIDSNPREAITTYEKAISIYKGGYLEQNKDDEWLTNVRDRYERMYLRGLFNILELLKTEGDYEKILDICEAEMSLIPLNERLNIYFLEALINLGYREHAFNHYQYLTSRLYKEMNRAPSDEMRQLYRKLRYDSFQKESIEISYIDEELSYDKEIEGAFLCELDYFKFLYNLEKRRNLRAKEKKSFIGTITLGNSSEIVLKKNIYANVMEQLKKTMRSTLRKGDVYAIWNENQMVFILYNIKEEDTLTVKERIIKEFSLNNKDINLNISIKLI